MKQIRNGWIGLCLMVMGCDHATDKTTSVDSTDTTKRVTAHGENQTDTTCYLAVQNRDTIWLQLYRNHSEVKGHMQYDNFEMDGNIGTIQATEQDGRIEGYFRFFSEGMWSVREIIFEQKDSHLVQAQTANMVYSSDTARYQNKSNLTFDARRVFIKWDCRQIQPDAVPQ